VPFPEVGDNGGTRRYRRLRDPATGPHPWPVALCVEGRGPRCPHSNDYDYVSADPVNSLDLDGRRSKPRWLTWKNAAKAGGLVAFAGCVAVSLGVCAGLGIAAGTFSAWANSDNGRGKRCLGCFSFGKSFLYNAAWVGAGYGAGRGLRALYSRARGQLRPPDASYRLFGAKIGAMQWFGQTTLTNCSSNRNASCSRRGTR